jgi:hypothetical protein
MDLSLLSMYYYTVISHIIRSLVSECTVHTLGTLPGEFLFENVLTKIFLLLWCSSTYPYRQRFLLTSLLQICTLTSLRVYFQNILASKGNNHLNRLVLCQYYLSTELSPDQWWAKLQLFRSLVT